MLTLIEWRRARGYSKQEMADKLNVHLNTYSNWESAPSKIGIGYAVKIADILNVALLDINFFDEDTTKCCK